MSYNRSRLNRSSSARQLNIDFNPIEYSSPAIYPRKTTAKKSTTVAAKSSSTQSKSAASANIPATEQPVKAPPPPQPQPRKCIFMIGSPEKDPKGDRKKVDEGFGMFIQNCFGCKKKLNNQDIFLFEYLKAFCSEDCRDDDIDIEYMGRPRERPITRAKATAQKLDKNKFTLALNQFQPLN